MSLPMFVEADDLDAVVAVRTAETVDANATEHKASIQAKGCPQVDPQQLEAYLDQAELMRRGVVRPD